MALRSASDPGETPFDGRLLSPVIGLEIRGLRLDGPLTKAVVAGLKAAFLRHHVLVIRGQDLTPEQQIAFAEAMGEPDIYPFVAGIDGYPVITPVIKEPEETQNFGGVWHTDTAYLKCPPAATMLLAREIPPTGGDTLFASQVAAYDALSDGMKALLAPAPWAQHVGQGQPDPDKRERETQVRVPGGRGIRSCAPIRRRAPKRSTSIRGIR